MAEEMTIERAIFLVEKSANDPLILTGQDALEIGIACAFLAHEYVRIRDLIMPS
jgi:hypothetical protein